MDVKGLIDGMVTPDDVAAAFGCSRRTVDRWERQGLIPRFRKFGNHKVLTTEELRDVLEGRSMPRKRRAAGARG